MVEVEKLKVVDTWLKYLAKITGGIVKEVT